MILETNKLMRFLRPFILIGFLVSFLISCSSSKWISIPNGSAGVQKSKSSINILPPGKYKDLKYRPIYVHKIYNQVMTLDIICRTFAQESIDIVVTYHFDVDSIQFKEIYSKFRSDKIHKNYVPLLIEPELRSLTRIAVGNKTETKLTKELCYDLILMEADKRDYFADIFNITDIEIKKLSYCD
jgi:hypothetical protein